MIENANLLSELVDSDPRVDEYLTDRQAFLLDRALIWCLVEEGYGLEPDTLDPIYGRNEFMSQEVLNILWDLNGGGPVVESEGPDLWL